MRVRKLIASLTILILCGCTKTPDEPVLYRLSDEFGVCIRLPKNASYQFRSERIDFDLVDLIVNGNKVRVYVGMQPDFDTESWGGKDEHGKGYVYLGNKHVDGQDKFLWGYRRYLDRGPLFIMFEGANLGPIKRELTDKNLLVDCLPSNW